MLLQYGPLSLNFLNVEEFERLPVYDGPNFLYEKITIGVVAVVNRATQSDSLIGDSVPRFNAAAGGSLVDGNGNALPFVPNPPNPNVLTGIVGPIVPSTAGLPALGSGPNPNAGRPAAYTSKALLHDLLQPRQRLVFSVGGVIVVLSPAPGFATDAHNGPTPLDASVLKQTGPTTWRVRFRVETCVNESVNRLSPANFGYVLSHRWSCEHRLDRDFFTTRHVTGQVKFRADMVNVGPDNNAGTGFTPDAFRSYLAMPVPAGFARRNLNVTVHEDLLTYSYSYDDVELPVGWSQFHVTEVKCAHSFTLERANLEKVVSNALLETARLTALPQVPVAGEASHLLPALGLLAAKTALDGLPVSTHSCVCEVWGDTFSIRNDLTDFAYNIIKGRINTLVAIAGLFVGGVKFEITHYPTEKHVLCAATFTTGPLATSALLVTGQFSTANLFGATDDTGNLLKQGATPQGPVNDNGSRSGYLALALAGALQGDPAQNNHAASSPPDPPVRVVPPIRQF